MPDTLVSPAASPVLTVESLRFNVLRQLKLVPYVDTHTNSLTTTAATLTVASDATQRYKVGDVIEWPYDGTNELGLLTAVAATQLTVIRGYLTATPGTGLTHAANAHIALIPEYYATNCSKAVQDALDSDLYPELFAVYETQLTHGSTSWSAVSPWRSIAAEADEVLHAYQHSDSSPVVPVECSFSDPVYVDTTLSSTKRAVKLRSVADSDNTVFLQYLRSPGVGDLSAGMGRVVEAGAIARLLEWHSAFQIRKEGKVVQDGIHVPGIVARTASFWRDEQQRLINQERTVLDRRFPHRRRRRIGRKPRRTWSVR